MLNKQLRFLILAGIFAIPFVPFIVSSSLFFPFITGKAFIFRIIVEIIFAAWLCLAFREEKYRPKFSWILAGTLLFLVVVGVTDIFSANPFKSFWSNYERMEGYISMLHFVAFFVVTSSMLKTKKEWNALLATSVGASVMMSIYSFLQLAGKITINQGGVRVDGTLGNATYLAIYMVFHIFFAALLFSRSNKMWQKILLTVVAVLDIVVLYHTATRGAILGLIGGAFVSFIYLVFKSEKGSKIRKVAAVGIISLVILIGAFFVFRNNNYVKNNPVLGRFASLSVSEIKTQGRYFVWPMAIKGFLERPILGWGQESFNFVFNKYYDPRMYNQEPWFDRAHNTFLDWLVAGGALGLIAYLSLFFALFYSLLKSKNENFNNSDKAIIIGLTAAYVFNNLFVFDQISSYILFFTLLAFIHSFSEYDCKIWNKISNKLKTVVESENWQPILESLAVIFLILVLYFVNYIPWQQNRNLMIVLAADNQKQILNISEYSKLFENYNMGFPESLEHILGVVVNAMSNSSATNDFKQKLFDVSDKSFETQLSKVPNDARYRLFYGEFLAKFGRYDDALTQLQKAQELSPDKQAIYFEIVNVYLTQGKSGEALNEAKAAYDLEPEYDEAKIVYGLVAGISGQSDLSSEIFSKVEESKLISDDRYLSLLAQTKQYDKLIQAAQSRVNLEPNSRQSWITLAAAYLEAGQRTTAVQILQEIIKADPTFKDQGEYYIKEIEAGRNP